MLELSKTARYVDHVNNLILTSTFREDYICTHLLLHIRVLIDSYMTAYAFHLLNGSINFQSMTCQCIVLRRLLMSEENDLADEHMRGDRNGSACPGTPR